MRMNDQLWVEPIGELIIKYRITYPLAIADLAGEDSSKFLHHFDWP